MNNLRDQNIYNSEELLVYLQKRKIQNHSADWIGEHLLVYGHSAENNDDQDEYRQRKPCLFLENAKPSITNFVTLLWNRLFSYPHHLLHVNGVIQSTDEDGRNLNFQQCLNTATNLFADSDIGDKVLKAHRFLNSLFESSWRPDSRVPFRRKAEAVTSVSLEFDADGRMIGGRFNLTWLNDSSHLVDVYDQLTPVFSLLRNMASWVQISQRELDENIFGKNLKRYLKETDTLPEHAQEFEFGIALLKAYVDKETFLSIFRLLSCIYHIQRIRAGVEANGKMNIFNVDGLAIFCNLLKIDLKDFRFAILTEFGKSKSDLRVMLGTKDPKMVNQDVNALAVSLYRALVTYIVDVFNNQLSSKNRVADIELFSVPVIHLDDQIPINDYETFCKNIISDILGYSLFEHRTKVFKKKLQESGVELLDNVLLLDDYLKFYFGSPKNPALVSIITQEKSKMDAQRIVKQMYSDLKSNKRVFKPSDKNKRMECIVGLQHLNENIFWYNVSMILQQASSVIPSNIPEAMSTCSNPIISAWKKDIRSIKSLDHLMQSMLQLSDKLASQKSMWLFDIYASDNKSVSKQSITSFHLMDLMPQRPSHHSEFLSHCVVLERYYFIVHAFDERITSSQTTTGAAFRRLNVNAMIGSQGAFVNPREFYKLEMRLYLYQENIKTVQKCVRGFVGRCRFKHLHEKAEEYKKQICSTLSTLDKLQTSFLKLQHNVTKCIVEDDDIDKVVHLMKEGDFDRTKLRHPGWGLLFIISNGRVLHKINLVYEFYWIFGSTDYSASQPYEMKLNDLKCFEDDVLLQLLGSGFYLRKSPNGNISIKRKSRQNIHLWGTDVECRNSITSDFYEHGLLPFNEFVDVFDISAYTRSIARAIQSDKVCSTAIEMECVIPLMIGSEFKYTTLTESPLCCVLIDFSIKDRLRHEGFNKGIREEVNRLQRGKEPQRPLTHKTGKKSRDLYSHEASIHSLLIRMDKELQKTIKIEEDDVHHRRRRRKWSKEGYNERKIREKLEE